MAPIKITIDSNSELYILIKKYCAAKEYKVTDYCIGAIKEKLMADIGRLGKKD
jgi:hypothetical protein